MKKIIIFILLMLVGNILALNNIYRLNDSQKEFIVKIKYYVLELTDNELLANGIAAQTIVEAGAYKNSAHNPFGILGGNGLVQFKDYREAVKYRYFMGLDKPYLSALAVFTEDSLNDEQKLRKYFIILCKYYAPACPRIYAENVVNFIKNNPDVFISKPIQERIFVDTYMKESSHKLYDNQFLDREFIPKTTMLPVIILSKITEKSFYHYSSEFKTKTITFYSNDPKNDNHLIMAKGQKMFASLLVSDSTRITYGNQWWEK